MKDDINKIIPDKQSNKLSMKDVNRAIEFDYINAIIFKNKSKITKENEPITKYLASLTLFCLFLSFS